MAKKTLNEATIRRFQKLAKVAPLTENYYGRDDIRENEEEEEELAGDELAADAEMDAEMDADMDAEAAVDDAAAGQDVTITDEEAAVLIELGEKLSSAMEGGEEETELAPIEDEELAGDALAADEEEELMEALAGISYVPSQTEVVNEVAKRVARRLKAAKLHEAKLNRALGRK